MDYCARLEHVERCCTTSVKSPVVSHYSFDNYIRQLVDLFTALRSVRHEVDASAKAVSVQNGYPAVYATTRINCVFNLHAVRY